MRKEEREREKSISMEKREIDDEKERESELKLKLIMYLRRLLPIVLVNCFAPFGLILGIIPNQ